MRFSKNKNTGIIVVAIIIFGVFYFLNSENEIVYSDHSWDCEYVYNQWQCGVTLEIENRTHEHQYRKMSIRGMRVPANNKYTSMKICGEKLIDVDLSPLQKLKIYELVKMNRKPNEININIWKQ